MVCGWFVDSFSLFFGSWKTQHQPLSMQGSEGGSKKISRQHFKEMQSRQRWHLSLSLLDQSPQLRHGQLRQWCKQHTEIAEQEQSCAQEPQARWGIPTLCELARINQETSHPLLWPATECLPMKPNVCSSALSFNLPPNETTTVLRCASTSAPESAWKLQEPRIHVCVDHSYQPTRWAVTADLIGPIMWLVRHFWHPLFCIATEVHRWRNSGHCTTSPWLWTLWWHSLQSDTQVQSCEIQRSSKAPCDVFSPKFNDITTHQQTASNQWSEITETDRDHNLAVQWVLELSVAKMRVSCWQIARSSF